MSINRSEYKNLPSSHQFDFKVSVNYQNGNVKIRGPNEYCPPSINFQLDKPLTNVFPRPPIENIVPHRKNNSNHMQPDWKLGTQFRSPNPRNLEKKTSEKTLASLHIQKLPQNVECVICQRSFESHNFDEHLQIHKNRSKKRQQSQPVIKIQQESNIRYGKYVDPKTQYSVRRDEEYSFQKQKTQKFRQNSILGSHTFSSPQQSFHQSHIQQKQQQPSPNILLNLSSSIHQSNQQSQHHNYTLPHPQNSSYNIGSNQISVQSNSSYADHDRNRMSNQFSKNQLFYAHPVQIKCETEKGSQKQIVIAVQNQSNSSNPSKLHSFRRQHQDNFENKNYSMQYDRNNFSRDANQINYSYTSNRIPRQRINNNYLEQIETKNSPKINQSNILHEAQNSSSSSIDDVMQTLEKLSREEMMAMSQPKQSFSVRSQRNAQIQSSHCQFRQFPFEDFNNYERNSFKSMQQSFVSNKPLSAHLHQLEMKNLRQTKVFRGIQVDEKQIIQNMKESQSTNSKMSKSSKTKMPKNSLAVFQHLTVQMSQKK